MQVKVGRIVTDKMLVILRIVSAKECEHALSIFPVDIAHLIKGFCLTKNYNFGLHLVTTESGGLPHEAPDHLLMVLAEDCRHNIPFC